MGGGGTSLVRYPGGKFKLRGQIAQRLAEQAEHDGLEFREPFFGGGSIGLKLLSDDMGMRRFWINDKDVGIACLWTSIIRYPGEFKGEFVASCRRSRRSTNFENN